MRYFSFLMLSLSFLTVWSAPAYAVKTCYNPTEYEAEQGLRIHSELMVIALNCQNSSHRRGNLYLRYRDFTRQHQALFEGYENTMISYYRRAGYANSTRALHDLRTNLANEVSTIAAKMRPDIFCYKFSDRVNRALELDDEAIRRWAKSNQATQKTSVPLCRDRDY